MNGQAAKLEYDPENPDIAKLLLPQRAGGRGPAATITTPFRVKLPASFSRFGHVGQSYQISQWYPKPAVLDRRGWHPMPYLDQGEFYSEFGSFDVSITLPANYTVGATGELQNPDEQARLAAPGRRHGRARKPPRTSAPTWLSRPPHADHQNPALQAGPGARLRLVCRQALQRAEGHRDAALGPHGAVVGTVYQQGAREVDKGPAGRERRPALLLEWVGEYPYASATAVDGALAAGGGMEYPMVTVTAARRHCARGGPQLVLRHSGLATSATFRGWTRA